MTAMPLGETYRVIEPVEHDLAGLSGQTPNLEIAYSEGVTSRDTFDRYISLREQAATKPKVEGEALLAIQEASRAWVAETGILDLPEGEAERTRYYGSYDRDVVRGKIEAFTDFLDLHYNGVISDAEIEATRIFIDSAFNMYEDAPTTDNGVMEDADGSFAFIVPARMDRDKPEYGEEVELVAPALRYLPNELRAQMMIGLPPFVIDTYEPNEEGRRGYLIFAPVFGDMQKDIESRSNQMGIARQHVNNAVDYARRRHGVDVAGLGATLPSLTMYGKYVTNPDVITTTGHGGTTELIALTAEAGLNGRPMESIGVLGMGAIGASVAEVLAERYPNIPVSVFDINHKLMEKVVARNEGRLIAAESDAELIASSQVIVSAIVGELSLKAMGIDNVYGKVFVDDSQPAALNPAEVEAAGGNVLWVVGQDPTNKVLYRNGYDYASLADKHTDAFGCELEAALLARYMTDMRQKGMSQEQALAAGREYAIHEAVTPDAVNKFTYLFERYGIVAALPQAFGKHVELKTIIE